MKKYPHRVNPVSALSFLGVLVFLVAPTSANVGQGKLDFDSLQRLTMRHWKVRSSKTERQWITKINRLLEKRLVDFPSSRQLSEFSATIVRLCSKYEIDPVLVLSMMQHESGFNPHALSPMGARGLMQLMPGTAQFVVDRLLDSRTRSVILAQKELNLEDPFLNVTLGIAYLHYLRNRYADNLPQFLAAYNAGPGAVDIKLGKDLGPRFERWAAVYPYILAVSGSIESIRNAMELHVRARSL